MSTNESIIEFLNWDSNFFNLKTGKIEFNKGLGTQELKKVKNSILKSNFDLIYIYTDINHTPLRFLYETGSELIDTQLDLQMHIPQKIEDVSYCFIDQTNFQEYIKLEELYRISDQIASISRFIYDYKIKPQKVSELYRLIIDNSLNKTYGDGLIIDIGDDKILKGLISLKTECNSGLELIIGVDNTFKRSGIATKLFKKSLSYWAGKNIKEIKTVVSLKNIESLNFHLSLGYKIKKISNIFHLWLNKK